MRVYDMLSAYLQDKPDVHMLYVGEWMWEQHLGEEMGDALHDGSCDPSKIAFYVVGPERDVRIVCDPKLKKWEVSCMRLPEGV